MTGDKVHKLLERPDIDTWPESAPSGTEQGMSLTQAHLWQVHSRREKIERRYEFPPGHDKAFFGRLSTAPQPQAGYPTRQYELRSKRPAVQHQLPGVRPFLNGEGGWAKACQWRFTYSSRDDWEFNLQDQCAKVSAFSARGMSITGLSSALRPFEKPRTVHPAQIGAKGDSVKTLSQL